jgi:hypothetical protein
LPFLRMRASKYCLTSRICPTDTILCWQCPLILPVAPVVQRII